MRSFPSHGKPCDGGTELSAPNAELNYRAIFISDVHLGMRSCQAPALLDFLKHIECEVLYLVGDIVDFWKFRRGPHWPQSHNDVLQKLLRKARKGTRVVFIPGNHDDGLRDYAGVNFGGIELRRDALHVGANGKRYLVLHGDEFDVVVRYARWLAFLGDRSYDVALALNVPLNFVRRMLGLGHWSLAAFLKLKVKSAVNYIGEFEEALDGGAQARRPGAYLRPHPPRQPAHDRRHSLPQLRRLGRKLHGNRRTL